MDSLLIHQTSQVLPQVDYPHHSIYHRTTPPSSDTSSPILVIAILGIIITAFLLLSYYVFVIKCWLNLHRIGLLRRFFTSQSQRYEDPLVAYEPAPGNGGVDEAVIRAIPIFQFKRGERDVEEKGFYECAVCLNEFEDEEKLRVLPSCTHAFHIDCIDIWLQNNANCPLCRSSILTTSRFPSDQVIAPSTSPQDQSSVIDTPTSVDEDFLVIEVSGGGGGDDASDGAVQTVHRDREIAESKEFSVLSVGSVRPVRRISHSPRKLDQRVAHKKKRKLHLVSSMGDECIDIRCKDDEFLVQPIRRSFSMDSSTDRQLYLAVQEIIQQNRHVNEVNSSEDCSTRVRRSMFSFNHGRGSRNAVIPVEFEP